MGIHKNIVYDSSANQAHGKIQGATWDPSQRGLAFHHGGVSCGTKASLHGPTSFSICIFVKVPNKVVDGILVEQRGSKEGEYILSVDDGKPSFRVYGDNKLQFDFSAGMNINNDVWHLIVAVRDGIEGRIYVDGVLGALARGEKSCSLDATNPVFIGWDARDTSRFLSTGVIRNLRIFSRALSLDEIASLWKTPDTALESPVSWWKMDQPHQSPDPTWESKGFMSFDGTGGLPCGTKPSLDGTSRFSVCAWIKTPPGAHSTTHGTIIQQKGLDSGYLLDIWQGKPGFTIYGGGAKYHLAISGDTLVNDGKWHLVTASRYGADGKLYVDGKPASSVKIEVAVSLKADDLVYIGFDGIDNKHNFTGSIYDVQIYQPPLEDSQVSWLVLHKPPVILKDYSKSGAHAIVNKASWDPSEGAFYFNNDGRITCRTKASLDGTDSFSICVQVKVPQYEHGGTIIQQRGQGNAQGGEYILSVDNDKPSFLVYGDNKQQFDFSAGTPINDEKWHLIIAVRDGIQGRLYIDGVIGAVARGEKVAPLKGNIPVFIGYDGRNDSNFFAGYIRDVQIYPRALNTDEIEFLNKNTVPATSVESPVAWWKMGVTDEVHLPEAMKKTPTIMAFGEVHLTEASAAPTLIAAQQVSALPTSQAVVKPIGEVYHSGVAMADVPSALAHSATSPSHPTNGIVQANGMAQVPSTHAKQQSAGPWWQMDPATVLKDSEALGTSGTVWNEEDGSLSFNGNSGLSCGTKVSLDGEIPFSIAAWVKVPRGVHSDDQAIIIQQRGPGDEGYDGEYMLYVKNGRPGFLLYGGGKYQFDFSAEKAINDGKWHLVIALRNGREGHLYVDGDLVASVVGDSICPLKNHIPVFIGFDGRENDDFFTGFIRNLQIFKRALTPQELAVVSKTTSIKPSYGLPSKEDIGVDGGVSFVTSIESGLSTKRIGLGGNIKVRDQAEAGVESGTRVDGGVDLGSGNAKPGAGAGIGSNINAGTHGVGARDGTGSEGLGGGVDLGGLTLGKAGAGTAGVDAAINLGNVNVQAGVGGLQDGVAMLGAKVGIGGEPGLQVGSGGVGAGIGGGINLGGKSVGAGVGIDINVGSNGFGVGIDGGLKSGVGLRVDGSDKDSGAGNVSTGVGGGIKVGTQLGGGVGIGGGAKVGVGKFNA